MCKKLTYLISFVLVLGLVGSASAAVLYSDSFDRPDGNTLGTNDNALGGIVTAPWVEVEGNAAQIGISSNAYSAQGGNNNGYIDHKFTSAELGASFTIEFDVMPATQSNQWFNVQFGPEPASFTTDVDVNTDRVPFGFLFRAQNSFRMWDSAVLVGINRTNIIDNSTNPARVKLEFDSPDGYSDGNTATVRLWINDVLVEELFGSGDSHDFQWDGHTDGLYISFENNGALQKIVDNLVISSPFVSLTQALEPSPENEATDVLRDVALSWTPGEYSDQHDVYVGTSFDDVNNATNLDPMGADKVYRARQSANSYAFPKRLDLGQTYYWRIDEVNAPPTSHVVFKGDVWSFTVEPVGYAIENINVTASSSAAAKDPENTINGSGLNDSGLLHDKVGDNTMWLSDIAGPQPTWIEFQFDKVYKLHEMWVWNSNESLESVLGLGCKDVTIEYSVDGIDYTTLGTTHEFARAPGASDYAHNTIVDFGGVPAKYVRLTANSNWGGILNQYGLSEVRFFFIPIQAREPNPDSGTTDVDLDVTLSWRAGREAVSHDVYVSTDEQAVIDSSAPVTTVPETSYGPLSLDLAQTYYWKVNEVNMAETPTTLEGDVWNLTTREFLIVDDFESYNDLDPDDPESNRIFNAWVDGYEQPANGSIVGYASPPFAEQTIVHSGGQSMPLFYDNTGTARYSEAELTLSPAQDWTKNGISALSLWFSGDPNNAPDQMYVKINGSKVAYDGDASNLTLRPWQPWNIDLVSLGTDLQNVTKLSIGLGDETSMVPGGSGKVFFDDVRLYPYSRQLVTPADPGAVGLQAHYEFEGNTNDSSGNARHGTSHPMFVPGKTGQAIGFNGIDQYVTITGYKGILADASGVQQPFTVSAWVKTIDDGDRTIASWGTNTSQLRVDFRLFQGRLRVEHGAGNVQGDTTLNDDEWHHVAVTVSQGATISYPEVQLWLDGMDNTRDTTDPEAFSIAADVDMAIGYRATAVARYFFGAIDEVRLYDRALSSGEIAWLAGRIQEFDKPF